MFGAPLPSVANKFTDAIVAVLLANTLLAVFVILALVVKGINGFAFAHFGHGTIAQEETVTTVGPVLPFVEFSASLNYLL